MNKSNKQFVTCFFFVFFFEEEAKPAAAPQEKKVKEKKEQLSKAQKRKMAERVDVRGKLWLYL